jgi:UDP-N-acetylglucosamine 2-epimerase (non-hydrolysing)
MKLLIVIGTRPEAIKLAPLILQAKKAGLETIVCSTGQHREMLDQVLNFFSIEKDYDFNLMSNNQTLPSLTSKIIERMDQLIDKVDPDWVIVQGDTTTAMASSLSAFYRKKRVAHIEAGLRSKDMYSPFPEEINRKLISSLATLHFCPTDRAMNNLKDEGFFNDVYVVGNTVVDALLEGEKIAKPFPFDFSKPTLLVTLHRRESFGEPMSAVCDTLIKIVSTHNVNVIFPVHPNPNVRKVVNEKLSNVHNVHLIDPLDYPSMIGVMKECFAILTDSGGIQEEAPTFGKPVLVLREVTERIESVIQGSSKIVGCDSELIFNTVSELINNEKLYSRMSSVANPYGDGTASIKILDILKKYE